GGAGTIDRQAWLLFAILFLWQFPHFLAIALMYRQDYARACYRMLPSFDEDSQFTLAEILGFAIILVATTILPMSSGPGYLIAMALAGAFLLYHVIKLTTSVSPVLASRLLHASVVYLPVVLGIMIIYKH